MSALGPGTDLSASEVHTPSERRRDSRLDINVDLTLRRIGVGGTVLQEERTVADNIARHGARVLTTITALGVSDFVWVQEVGGDFQAWSTVRHASTGKDNIRRIGIEFLTRTAPDRLVVTDALTTRTPRPAPPSPATPLSPPHSDRRVDSRFDISVEVLLRKLGPEHAVLWEERTVADNFGRRGARVKTAMTGLAVGDVVSLQEVGGDFQARGAIRSVFAGRDGVQRLSLAFLDGSAPARLVPLSVAPPGNRRSSAAATQPVPPPPPTPAPGRASTVADTPRRDAAVKEPALEEEIEKAEKACRSGQHLLAEEKYWDAIQTLEAALGFAKGTRTNHRLRILLARALAKNAIWVRRAEQLLLDVLQEDPRYAEAYAALGALYKAVGMKSRARTMLARALELDPRHAEAAAELRSLESAGE